MNPTFFETGTDFRRWLSKNHKKETELLVGFYKVNSGKASMTWSESVDEALCYGWIDGLRRGLDDDYYVQKVTPRRAKSIWSVINKNKVAQLIKAGRMKEAGLAAIEEAKKNGQWNKAYHSQANITVPEELQKALDKNKNAKQFFEKLSSRNRYALLFRIHQAKREETKMKKIAEFIKMLESNKTIYPQ